MAIKGKSKSRARRPATNAPRPVVVAPKRPFLARRSTRWGILGLVLAAAAVTLLLVWNNEQDKRIREDQGLAIDQVSRQIDLLLEPVSQPGAGSAPTVLPEFVPQVEALKAGAAPPADVAEAGRPLPKLLDTATESLAAIEVPEDLRNTEYTGEVIDARTTMTEALKVYKVAVQLVLDAVEARGADRRRLLDRASEQITIGARLFGYGYQKLTNIRIELGTFSSTEFNPLPPQPGG